MEKERLCICVGVYQRKIKKLEEIKEELWNRVQELEGNLKNNETREETKNEHD